MFDKNLGYKLINKIKKSGKISISEESKCYYHCKVNGEPKIISLNKDLRDSTILNFNEIHRYKFTGNYLLISFKNGYTEIINLKTNNKVKIEEKLSFALTYENQGYIIINSTNNLLIYDKIESTIEEFTFYKELIFKAITDSKLIFYGNEGNKIFIFDIDLIINHKQKSYENIPFITWSDTNENTTLYEIIIKDQLLLILKGTSVICLNIETGKVVWSLNSEIAKQMGVISGEYLYTASNTSLTKIAIASGEVEYAIRFQKEYQLEKLITLYGIEELTLFEDELWAYTKFGTLSLVCIDKETAYFKKVIPLESLGIKTGIFSFQFYKDKLFIHDHDYTLYIFEKEETDLI